MRQLCESNRLGWSQEKHRVRRGGRGLEFY